MVRFGTKGLSDVIKHVKQILAKQDDKSRNAEAIINYVSVSSTDDTPSNHTSCLTFAPNVV